jgi:hypothetical protein
MDRNEAGKTIYIAKYIASGIIPPGTESEALVAKEWDTLAEELKEEYRQTGEAFYNKLVQPFEGRIIKVENLKIEQVMTAEQLRYCVQMTNKHLEYRHTEEFLPLILEQAFRNLQNKEQNSLLKLKRFQDDILTFLRAIALVADSVGNAATHKEKSARMRGLIAQIESAIQKVRNGYEDLLTRYWYDKPDLFRSDYPVLQYIQKSRQLEEELKALKEGRTPEFTDGF